MEICKRHHPPFGPVRCVCELRAAAGRGKGQCIRRRVLQGNAGIWNARAILQATISEKEPENHKEVGIVLEIKYLTTTCHILWHVVVAPYGAFWYEVPQIVTGRMFNDYGAMGVIFAVKNARRN